ncbi:TPA: B3/4 domain-containing protein [Streptococcus agalactiae]
MTKFIVDSSYWNLFPTSKIGVILIKDYHMDRKLETELKQLLSDSHSLAKKYLQEKEFSQNRVIQTYRKAYQTFKTKKGARSSIEALLKRVNSGNEITSINPLVDIYNAASLRFGLPIGAEDSDTFRGDLKLTITNGGDEFYLIGEDFNRPTLSGELAYVDDVGAVCRCFNWRDGKRTMITDNTQNAFLVIELIDNGREIIFKEALDFIATNTNRFLKAKTQTIILDKEHSEITL